MDRTQAVVSRHDAAERLTYAALTRDQAGVDAAVELLARADEFEASEPDQATRQAIIDNDPLTAAAVGWLPFNRLVAIVEQEPDRYLDAPQAVAYASAGEPVLRVLVHSRITGVPFATAADQFLSNRSDYALAARGSNRNPRKLRQLLQEQGLLDNEK
ncbi:hypothetical protein [Nocardioides zeicaulis]|uniref:Uncharacterized protein n=1 Tax=Nocardioides zeicaulis TaxID=1776857 RepID=A0ABV6E1G8_9ACTN